MVEALGGEAALAAATAQTAVASGVRYDEHESFSSVPGEDPLTTVQMNFTSTVDVDLVGQGQHGIWAGSTVEVIPGTNVSWTETSDGTYGFTTGSNSGSPGMDPGFMNSIQVAMRWKQQAMSTPAVLAKWALANGAGVTVGADQTWNGASYHVLTLKTPWGWPADVHVFVDPVTHLPVKSDTLEEDPVRGDTLYEVAFADFHKAGSLQAPFAITHSLNGSTVQSETRSAVTTDTSANAGNAFAVPAGFQMGFDQAGTDWAKRSSQYFLRFQAFAFPLYFDQSVAIPPYVPGLVPHEVVPTSGAKVVQYQISYYNTMVVEMPTYLIVVEAPLYDSASAAVIADMKTRFPGKPVKAVVSTHFHFDHTGGIRRYLGEWPTADLYVPAESVDFYTALAKAPHTLAPDTTWKTPWTGSVKVVAPPVGGAMNGAATVLSDGGTTRTVKLFNMKVDHSKGTLVPILDSEQLLFTTDLDNPTGQDKGGSLPDGKERAAHDLYARQLYTNLKTAGAGYSPGSAPNMKFVGGHGAVGTWGELCVFGYGFGATGAPPMGTPIDASKVCP
jgi:glyoxylase-like metal-dependent hydrolase (beta-lactamase superfamily II)